MEVTLRRARPALGTLVDMGVCCGPTSAAEPRRVANAAIVAAFATIAQVESCLSIYQPDSDLARFHRLSAGEWLIVHPHTAQVLLTARALAQSSGGLFDISLGSGPNGWELQPAGAGPDPGGYHLIRHQARTCLDAGGIAKGHAVDTAIEALQAAGCTAGWVNAGGDLRCFGPLDLPLFLRDEHQGGTRPIGHLRDGAWATSHFLPPKVPGSTQPVSRSQLHMPKGSTSARMSHVSVAAPLCLWADALTKIVALTSNDQHPLLADYQATAWCHPVEPIDTECSRHPPAPHF